MNHAIPFQLIFGAGTGKAGRTDERFAFSQLKRTPSAHA